ncbi:MAG: DUF167 domain-containing protein [Actinomycetota bacterium]
MASVTVRVTPRSGRTAVERASDGGVLVRVRAAPEGGRATIEAAEAIAAWLGVAKGRVWLRTGARSRTKIYLLDGVPDEVLRSAMDAL